MRRKSAGKKLMAVLIAASLALTPAELTVAAEMEPEGEEAAFLAEESGDTASSDPEDTAETETEITDGSAATEEHKPQIQTSQIPGTTYRRMRKQA